MTASLVDAKIKSYFLIYSRIGWSKISSIMGVNSGWGFMVAAGVFMAGRTIIFPESEAAALHIGSVYGADCLIASVAQLRAIIHHQKLEPVPNTGLRLVITGGSALTRNLVDEISVHLCRNIIAGYGSTEAGVSAVAEIEQLVQDPHSVGYVTPWTEVEIVDANGALVANGAEGELRVRPLYGVANLYNQQAICEVGKNLDWFYPGDRGIPNVDGGLRITGRTNEVINIGGVKLYPDAIDDIVRQHPGVRDAAAFGFSEEGGATGLAVAILPKGDINPRNFVIGA